MKPLSTPVNPQGAVAANPPHSAHECLSALADGDLQSLQAACSLWRDDPEARRAWHRYHLIGDVLRSDDLAGDAGRDAAFLAGIRARLAAEPVVLAPAEAPPATRRRQPWLLPAAAVASVAVVAGVLVSTRIVAPDGSAAAPLVATSASGAAAPGLQSVSVDTQGVIRDPRLEELVRQHQASRGGIAVPLPGTLRTHPVSVER